MLWNCWAACTGSPPGPANAPPTDRTPALGTTSGLTTAGNVVKIAAVSIVPLADATTLFPDCSTVSMTPAETRDSSAGPAKKVRRRTIVQILEVLDVSIALWGDSVFLITGAPVGWG
jgi:hypothetical protein